MASLRTYTSVLKKMGFQATSRTGVITTTFATAWDMTLFKDMGDRTVSGALALTSVDLNAVPGGYTQATLIADGTHIPTFDGQTLANYNNTSGARNLIKLLCIGNAKYWSCSIAQGTIVVLPTPPVISVGGTIVSAQLGQPLTFTGATVSGNPNPTITYDVLINDVLVQSNVTSGSYTISSSGTLKLRTNANNGVGGTVTSTTAGTVISATLNMPEMAFVGDSLFQFQSNTAGLNNITMSRDTNGLVTMTKTPPLGWFGDQRVYFANVNTDTSFEVQGQGHYVGDNATYLVQTTVTGAPVAPFVPSTATLSLEGQPSLRGLWAHLQSAYKGGVKFKGNYGQGGDFASQMTGALTKAIANTAHYVVLNGGINDNKGNTPVATTKASIKANIDQIVAAGRVAVVLGISPLGIGFSGFATYNAQAQDINASTQAYCDGVTKIYVDAWTQLFDQAGTSNGGTPNGAYSWATWDTIHWTTRATSLVAANFVTAMAGKFSFPEMLPVNNGTAVPFQSPATFATVTRAIGPWPGYTTSSSFLGGGSGTRPDAWNAGHTTGSGTAVCSIVDPGDSKGIFFQAACSVTTASDTVSLYPDNNVGVTLAAAGFQIGDDVMLGCEVTWSNWTASGANRIWLYGPSNNSGAYLYIQGGMDGNHADPADRMISDSGSMLLFSGVGRISDAPSATGTIVGGTGYVNGTYTNVPLTGGLGSGLQATVVVSGGAVTTVTITSSSAQTLLYKVNDVLSAANTNLGGSGSGFTYTLTPAITGLTPQIQVGFSAVSQSPLTLQVRRFTYMKVTGVI